MKALILVLALLATVRSFAQQADKLKDDSPREQMRRLLDGLPPQRALSRYQDIVKHHETTTGKDELNYAREQVKLAQERVPKIRALIMPGTSIFDYPGLLAAGSIEYTVLRQLPDGTFEHGYQLYLGVFLDEEFTEPWDFHVVFNESGIVTAVKSVDWKH